MDRTQIWKMTQFLNGLDIATNPEPAAIFDPLPQGFNAWAIPSDNPGGDWEKIVDKFDAGSYEKRSEYVGCAFYNWQDNIMEISTDAYGLRDHMRDKYKDYKSIHNRKDDIEWLKEKVVWVFEQLEIPCPKIVVGDDN